MDLGQDLPSIDFPEGSFSFSQILQDGSQKYMSDSDVADEGQLFRSLEANGHFKEMNSLMRAAIDSGARPTAIEPAISNFESILGFDLLAGSMAREKNMSNWVCSTLLSKFFIKQDSVISLSFSYKALMVDPSIYLFIRATPIYTSPDFTKVPVQRCPTHSVPNYPSNAGLDEDRIQHVLRCIRDDAIYEKDPRSNRLSVKIPVAANIPECYDVNSQTRKESWETIVDYKFVCSTSCADGMERRCILVIFTLENMNGDVYGRRAWGFKICACPRRDMRREESDYKECSSSQDSGKVQIIKKELEMKNETPEEQADRCYFQWLNTLPAERLVEIRRMLAGRLYELENSPDENLRKEYARLLN